MRNLKITHVILVMNVLIAILMLMTRTTSMLRNEAYLLLKFGAQFGPLVARGEWYRTITAIFVHGGILHLLFNSYALFYFGTIVESIYGSEKFVASYLSSGLIGNIATQLFYYGSVSVGASGAIFGLVGMLFILGFKRDAPFYARSFTGYALLPMIIYNVVFGFLPGSGINNAAHLGGFFAGVLIGYLVKPLPAIYSRRRSMFYAWRTIAIMFGALVVYSFFMLIFHSAV
ncbi:rhomboid family intramembrane serine protease [Pseudothermotoga sp.]|nr:rhomboid family intramembrane serine protease [Pseudothermotoga sp.]MCX7812903.1 rhomboid family intramembrane serine protease [Pseudothermotoga sp.]MDW8139858.1 rhomboid family intramembrane serine protease [Pseudothermotoga sp.]